jgi:KDO2-lipid IV(A) lauroyltransferase
LIALRLLRSVARRFGAAAYALGIRRDVTLANLTLALPELTQSEREKIACESYLNLAIVFFEFLYLRFGSASALKRSLTLENEELLQRATESGKGVILLSGHLANWEWVAIVLGMKLEKSIRLVVKNQRSKRADRFLTNMRSRFGNTKVDAGDVRGIFAALNRKEYLGVLSDQAAPASSVMVPFFGVPVPTFEGVARLALRSRSPILFLRSSRTPTGYHCAFEEVAYDEIQESTPDAVAVLTARHTAILERAIRSEPALWVWQHRRWKDAKR